jgi:23S rRNA U2552 (ribose-2'-O)-methylase RlmE/FtsJ
MESVYPPTKYLTFGPWIYLVPQYKPKDVLILGYDGGTVAGLIRLLYGNIPITGVDIEHYDDLYGVTFIQEDAKEYVKHSKHFDTVIIDLFENGKVCDFVTSEEFINDVSKIANYIIIDTLNELDMSNWDVVRGVGMNKPSRCSNKIYYYRTVEISGLLP